MFHILFLIYIKLYKVDRYCPNFINEKAEARERKQNFQHSISYKRPSFSLNLPYLIPVCILLRYCLMIISTISFFIKDVL